MLITFSLNAQTSVQQINQAKKAEKARKWRFNRGVILKNKQTKRQALFNNKKRFNYGKQTKVRYKGNR